MQSFRKLAVLIYASASISTALALEPLQPFSWGTIIEQQPPLSSMPGQQILHFKTSDKSFKLNQQATAFVSQHFKHAAALNSDAATLRFASDHVKINGAYIELGVCTGRTVNLIAALNPDVIVEGFDSFDGLPEDWVREDKTITKGTFKFKDNNIVPPVLSNVRLYKGLFKDVLPAYVAENLKNQPIALLHVDCDLYSATSEALFALKNNIVPGTIIVFDEFYNYPGSEEHEFKALNEFLQHMNYEAKYLAFNAMHEQVVIEIVKE